MPGFDAGERELPRPIVDVAPETRQRIQQVLVAIVDGATPEEIADYLEHGFPDAPFLDEPGQREEFDSHIDTVLSLLQSPVEAAKV